MVTERWFPFTFEEIPTSALSGSPAIPAGNTDPTPARASFKVVKR